MTGETLIYQDDALRLYWHERQEHYLGEWQPFFRKGDEGAPSND